MLELHAFPASSPSRALHMALDLLGLDYQYVEVDFLAGGARTPEFLSINPQHTVPVLVEDNLVITESRAALTYLVSQHKPGQLYPACAKKRSQIDQRLQFNMGTFYKRLGDCVFPVCLGKTQTIHDENITALKEALMWVNNMVSGGYVLGNTMTIADVDFLATFSTLESCSFLDLSPYKNILVWAQKTRGQIHNYATNNQRWATAFGEWFKGGFKPTV